MAKGVLLIVCGPSGVGKTSLCDALLDRQQRLGLSVSYTTRQRRGDEVDGESYHFVDKQRFQQMRDDDEFAEWAEVHGNYYGTPTSVIEDSWESGQDLLFDIDYQGARQVKRKYPDATAVMIAPPDLETLAQRLRGRGTDSAEVIDSRLQAARHELAQYPLFDYVIENGDFDRAVDILESVYIAARHARPLKMEWVEKLLETGETLKEKG